MVPALSPGCGALWRVPFGVGPWLHHLLGWPSEQAWHLVWRFHRYYDRLRLPGIVHRRLRPCGLHVALRVAITTRRIPGSPSSYTRSVPTCRGSPTTSAASGLTMSPSGLLPSASLNSVGSRVLCIPGSIPRLWFPLSTLRNGRHGPSRMTRD
jgi:hypothetical protein